nr:isochorismatase family protein [Actinomycetota bacterium]
VFYSARSAYGTTIAQVAPMAGDTILIDESDRHYATLREALDSYGRDQLVVTGVRAHVACLMAAAGSYLAGIELFSVADATADLSLDDHRQAVQGAAEYGAMVTTTSQVIGQLLGVLA